MEIGKEASYISNNEMKTNTISWKSDTHAFFKKESGEFELVKLDRLIITENNKTQEVVETKEETKPSEKKGLISSFLSLFR